MSYEDLELSVNLSRFYLEFRNGNHHLEDMKISLE